MQNNEWQTTVSAINNNSEYVIKANHESIDVIIL